MKRVCVFAFALLYASGVLADATSLVGRWETPGKNIVEIRAEGGQFRGHIVKLDEGAAAVGFQDEEIILDGITLSGDVVRFDVSVRVDDPAQKNCAPRKQPFEGRLSGDTITGRLQKSHFSGCDLVLDKGNDDLVYRRESVSCLDVPDPDVYRLAAFGDHTEISIDATSDDPLGKADSNVAVKLTAGLSPFRRGEVQWRVYRDNPKLDTNYYTEADNDGVAKLEFVMLPNGTFAPTMQIRERPGVTLPPGDYEVEATAPQLNVKAPVKFKARLRRSGVLLSFTEPAGDGAGYVSEQLLDDSERTRFAVEVIDFSTDPPSESCSVTIRSIGADGKVYDSIELTVPQSSTPGVYRNPSGPVTAYPGKVRPGLDALRKTLLLPPAQLAMRVEAESKRSDVTAKNRLVIYKDPDAAVHEALRQTLLEYQKSLAELRAATEDLKPEQNAVLTEKERLVKRALELLDDPQLGPTSSVTGERNPLGQWLVAREYIRLLSQSGKPTRDTRPCKFRFSRYNEDGPDLRCQTAQEAAAVREAERQLYTRQEKTLAENARQLLAGLRAAPGMLQAAVKQYIAAPVLSAYILVTGLTLEGEDAETIDRILAGIDVASFVLHSPPRTRVTKRIGPKRQRLRAIFEEANEIVRKGGFQKVGKAELALAKDLSRFERAGEKVVDRILGSRMPDSLKVSMLEAHQQIWDSNVAQNLRERLLKTPKGNANRDVGLLVHWLKELKHRVLNDELVKLGKAELVEKGPRGGTRYRYKTPSGKTMESLIEWKIPGSDRQVDFGLVDHTNKTIKIVDYTHSPSPAHLRKGQLYQTLMENLQEFKGFKVSYCEQYWSPDAKRFIENVTARF